jgi:diguanylate cyclase (GGDEF)-like protein/PAS domain S-box-containing protein
VQLPSAAANPSYFSAGTRLAGFRPWGPEQNRLLAFWLIYALIWHAAWFGATLLGTFDNQISLWYPVAGLRFFVLLIFGWAALPPVVLIEGSLAFLLWFSEPDWFVLQPPTLNNHLEGAFAPVVPYLLAALALRTWNAGRSNSFSHLDYAGRFLGAALPGSALAAGVGAARMLYVGRITAEQFPEAWLDWLIGDFIGVITVTPLLLVHLRPRLRDWLQGGRWRQAVPPPWGEQRRWVWPVYLIGLSLFQVALFQAPAWLGWQADLRPFLTPFLMLFVLLPLAWGAVHGGLPIATLLVCWMDASLAVLVAWQGLSEMALYYQSVMIAVALMGLLLGAITGAHDQVLDRLHDLSRISNDLLWDTNADGRVTQLSGKLAWELAPGTGLWWRASICAIPVAHRKTLSAALRARRPFREVLLGVRNHAGQVRWLRTNGLPHWDELGRFAGYRGAATDITTQYVAERVLADYAEQLRREVAAQTAELRRLNHDLAFGERRYRTMLATAPVGVAEVDVAGRCQYANFPWCVLTGQAATAVLGRSWLEGVHPDQRAEMEGRWRNRATQRAGDGEFRSLANRWLSVYWSTLYDNEDGALAGAIVILNDITDRRQREQEHWELAHFDTLTQLPNRILFWDRLEQALRLASRHRHVVAVLWLDLDGFKAVNDTLGHAAGDELLRQVGQRLQANLRESDTAARLGGDEFAVVLATVAQARDATGVAQKIIEQIRQPFTLPQGPAHVSTSIGIAFYPDHAATARELAHHADLAMYAAKQAGKNGWRLWGDALERVRPGS